MGAVFERSGDGYVTRVTRCPQANLALVLVTIEMNLHFAGFGA